MLLNRIIFLFAILTMASCKKEVSKPDTNPPLTTPPIIIPPVQHTGPDVYVAGYVRAQNGHYVAAYWKNGVITKLSDSTLMSEASAIIVKDSDVYVAGISSSPTQGNTTVTYWKNGVATRLPIAADLGMSQSAFAMNGNDLYLAGDVPTNNRYVAYSWKNGISATLQDYSKGSFAYGIYTSGSDVYVTGYADGTFAFPAAVYWKNGVITQLGDGSKYQSMAYSIKANGPDVYVAGYTEYIFSTGNTIQATYWKNGVPTMLTERSVGSYAFDLLVNNSDVYVAGYVLSGINAPAYWKNGVQTVLDLSNVGKYAGPMTASMAMNGDDLYIVAGYPAYWKNGASVQLAKDGAAFGIFIVPN
jgi:uncharacterized membrane protein